MKLSFLCLTALLLASSVFADQTPVVGNIVGCYGANSASENGVGEVHHIVIRGGDELEVPWILPLEVGKLYVLSGQKRREGCQFGWTRLYGEGTTTLPNPYNENWTASAPEGTFYSARGNYKAIFLTRSNDNVQGSFVEGYADYPRDITTNLTCTQDLEALRARYVELIHRVQEAGCWLLPKVDR